MAHAQAVGEALSSPLWLLVVRRRGTLADADATRRRSAARRSHAKTPPNTHKQNTNTNTTNQVKAKVIRKYVDKMITLAKDGSLHARRQALGFVFDKELVANLFTAVPERYADRAGGYTRVKAEPYLRRGDATEMALIELV